MRVVVVLAAAALLGCGGVPGPPVENPYTGTWLRMTDVAPSVLAIRVEGATAWFRWHLRSDDGWWLVRCEWSGECLEYQGDAQSGDYRFRSWIEPRSGRLRVAVRRRFLLPEPGEEHWIDELVLEPDGRWMTAHTLERDGQPVPAEARASYRFRKVSTVVADPPRNLPGGTGSSPRAGAP